MSKHASRPSATRRWAYRPNLEHLEVRAQPGSLLLSGVGSSLLGSALDQGSLPPVSTTSDMSVLPLQRPTDQGNTLGTTVPLSATSSSSAPGQVGTVSTSSLPTSSSADLGPTAQPTAAHVVPVGSLAPAAVSPVAAANSVTAPSAPAASRLTTPTALPAAANYYAPVAITPVQSQAGSVSGWTSETIDAIGPQTVTTNWASYFGGPGANNALLKVTYTNGTNGMIVGGYTQDPTDATKVDPTVAQINRTGTSATIARYTGLPAGSRGEVRSVAAALDTNGNLTAIYVGGVAGTKAFVASLGPDLHNLTVNWSRVPPSSVTVPSAINGIALNAAGTDLYVTGSVGNSAIAGDLLASTGATNAYLETFMGTIGMDPVSTAVGNAIAVDSTGKADIALRIIDGTTNLPVAGWVQVATNGTMPAGMHGATSPGGDSREGNDLTFQTGMNGVSVDGAGNAYYTGATYRPGDMFAVNPIAKVAPDGQTLLYTDPSTGNPAIWEWGYYDASGHTTENFAGFDNKLNNGHNVVIATADDGTETLGSHFQALQAYGPNGDTSLDFGGPFGANDDFGYGIAQDTFNSSTYYLVGRTNSDDFSVGATFQPTFNGTVPNDYNGWVASVNSSGA